jgi:hypothetical protein
MDVPPTCLSNAVPHTKISSFALQRGTDILRLGQMQFVHNAAYNSDGSSFMCFGAAGGMFGQIFHALAPLFATPSSDLGLMAIPKHSQGAAVNSGDQMQDNYHYRSAATSFCLSVATS